LGIAELEDEAGKRTRQVFLVMAGIGLDVQMAQETSALAKRHLGWLAYVSPIAQSIIRNRLFSVQYRVDGGRSRSARAHTIIVGNCGTLTGSMLLLPAAKVDDGVLDVVMLRPKGRFGWARIGTRLAVQGVAHRSRCGRAMLELAPDLQALAYAQGRASEIRFEVPHAVQPDGDSFGSVSAARITVRPAALRVCTGAPGR
jgi:diacylglycerol kinase (ATP)